MVLRIIIFKLVSLSLLIDHISFYSICMHVLTI